ncbi:MAG: hypothetical protein U1E65_24970 [Myxococcota bacterium]
MIGRGALLLLPTLAMSTSAAASPPGRLVVAPLELLSVADAVAAELEAGAPARSITITSSAGPQRAKAIQVEVDRALALAERGQALLEDLELPQARAALNEAAPILGAYRRLDPRAEERWIEVWFELAVTILYAGDPALADAHFVAIRAAKQGFLPESGRYPSKVVKRFLGVTEAPTSVEIKCPDREATVLIADQERPPGLFEVSAGVHLVVVTRVGFWPRAEFAFVEAEGSVPVELVLEPDPVRRLADSWRALDDSALRAATGADELVRLEPFGLDDIRALWSFHGMQIEAKGAAPALAGLLLRARLAAEAPPPAPAPSLTEEPVFWGLVVAGAALVGGGVALAVALQSGASVPRSTGVLGF